jgi:hypothetical protein
VIRDFFSSIFAWAKSNLWNIFSLIGVVGTFYFSLVYVPDYVRQIAAGRSDVVHEGLVSDIQEMMFNKEELSINDIDSFIKGRELSYGVEYPFTADELLLQVQERFVDNKFIPLEQRRELVKSITVLREGYAPKVEGKKGELWRFDYLSVAISLVGMISALLGVVSIYYKHVADKEAKIDIGDSSIVESEISMDIISESAVGYERMSREIFGELGWVIKEPSGKEFWDFEISKGDISYIVECKKYRGLIGLRTIKNFFDISSGYRKNGILVVSSGVTSRARNFIENLYGSVSGLSLHVIIGDSREELKEKLKLL